VIASGILLQTGLAQQTALQQHCAPAQHCHRLPDCSDTTLDAETAWALGFTPATLTAEEEDLLPGDADEGVYCRVRPKPFA
jgi:hypothetical protein